MNHLTLMPEIVENVDQILIRELLNEFGIFRLYLSAVIFEGGDKAVIVEYGTYDHYGDLINCVPTYIPPIGVAVGEDSHRQWFAEKRSQGYGDYVAGLNTLVDSLVCRNAINVPLWGGWWNVVHRVEDQTVRILFDDPHARPSWTGKTVYSEDEAMNLWLQIRQELDLIPAIARNLCGNHFTVK